MSDLCTLADVRLAMGWPDAEHEQDGFASTLIASASALILDETRRLFVPTADDETRRFHVRGDMYSRRLGAFIVPLERNDLRVVDTVELHPEATAPITLDDAYYALEPYDAPDGVYTELRISGIVGVTGSLTWSTWGYALVDVTGDWGFAAVPADVSDLTAEVVRAWLSRDVAATAIADAVASGGSGLRTVPGQSYDLPPFARRRCVRWQARRGI